MKNQGTGLWIIGSSLCIPDGRVESATFRLKSPDSNNVVFQKAGVTPNILGNFKSGGNQGTIFRGSIFYTQTVYPQIFGETQKVGVYPVFIFHILSHIKNKNSAVNRHIER